MVDLPSVTYEVNVALVKLTVNHVGETLGWLIFLVRQNIEVLKCQGFWLLIWLIVFAMCMYIVCVISIIIIDFSVIIFLLLVLHCNVSVLSLVIS